MHEQQAHLTAALAGGRDRAVLLWDMRTRGRAIDGIDVRGAHTRIVARSPLLMCMQHTCSFLLAFHCVSASR
jgi:hypothetical protein